MGDDQRRFSEAEVEAILRRATARQDGGALSRDELADVLRQMNVDESALDEAIAEVDAEREVTGEVAAWKERRRRGFIGHAVSFASVMSLLVAVNLLVTPHVLWFVWPLLGWGFGLLSDYLAYRRGPDPEKLASRRRQQAERAERAQRKADKAQRKAKKREADEAIARASEELKDAVKVSVAGMMESVGKVLREAGEAPPRRAPTEAVGPRSGVRIDAAPAPREVTDEDVEGDLEALREKVARKGGR